ncbi:MAG: hypothetical protein JXA71_07395 [Chitinispirillaceae bacterium]|nr:hypothetical protein [Chitinispirillaceae bacterium]
MSKKGYLRGFILSFLAIIVGCMVVICTTPNNPFDDPDNVSGEITIINAPVNPTVEDTIAIQLKVYLVKHIDSATVLLGDDNSRVAAALFHLET